MLGYMHMGWNFVPIPINLVIDGLEGISHNKNIWGLHSGFLMQTAVANLHSLPAHAITQHERIQVSQVCFQHMLLCLYTSHSPPGADACLYKRSFLSVPSFHLHCHSAHLISIPPIRLMSEVSQVLFTSIPGVPLITYF